MIRAFRSNLLSWINGAFRSCGFQATVILKMPKDVISFPQGRNDSENRGAFQTWRTLPGLGLSGGQHQAGTCRMGNDPQTSVTDRYGRVHDTPNVFVADASLHVNNGGFNPALTIMALGYWVGGHIAAEWQKGNRFT